VRGAAGPRFTVPNDQLSAGPLVVEDTPRGEPAVLGAGRFPATFVRTTS